MYQKKAPPTTVLFEKSEKLYGASHFYMFYRLYSETFPESEPQNKVTVVHPQKKIHISSSESAQLDLGISIHMSLQLYISHSACQDCY